MTLSTFKKKTITLDELYLLLANNNMALSNRYKTVEYNSFYTMVNDLVDLGMLTPCGKATNSRPNKLYLKYRIVKPEKERLTDEELIWITNLNPSLNLEYYKKNVSEFRNHRQYIDIINNYINSAIKDDCIDYISVNERSYELFLNEKFLKGADKNNPISGLTILKNLKLNLTDIYCYDNYEPLLIFTMPGFFSKTSRNILIIENLDTYWTINRILLDYKSVFGTEVDMLIYGQGNAIVGRFDNYDKYHISADDNILYFGDIDNHGFYIFNEFKNKFNNLNINLATEWYEHLLRCVESNKVKKVRTLNQKRVDNDTLKSYMNEFGDTNLLRVLNILNNDCYIPQEGVNYSNIKKYISK